MSTTSQLSAVAAGTFTLGADLSVHRLGYGTMQLPGPGVWGPPDDRDEAIAVLRHTVELGVNLIDTADAYGPFVTDELIRAALHPYPDELVIATKVGFTRQGPGKWAPVGRPEYLRQQTELNLRHLKVDRLDLLQLHRIGHRRRTRGSSRRTQGTAGRGQGPPYRPVRSIGRRDESRTESR